MADSLDAAFHHLTATSGAAGTLEPYPHQTAVAQALLSGRRVVLRAPTGSGKSCAAWFPWLAARIQHHDFPPHMVHALPGGAVLCDLVRQFQSLASPFGDCRVGVQTEADAFDPFFLSHATFTTVEQLTSIALHRPLGLHPGLANINAGALLGAYLVFDEFPAFASPDALLLWLGLLRQHYRTSPCLLNTATLPRAFAAWLADVLNAEFIDAGDCSLGGRRQWKYLPAMGAENILYHHRQRTIVVCNSVRGAQTLFRTLQHLMAQESRGHELLLLHPYLRYHDRREVEQRVKATFGRDSATPAIMVTTSAITVGEDISADTLITDPAPPDVLLRRAGRCARYAGEEGQVLVARVTLHTPAETYPTPSYESLLDRLSGDTPRTSADELQTLDDLWAAAHPEQQPAILQHYPTLDDIDAIPRRFLTHTDSAVQLFPRVSVCLHRVPETVSDPFELERFSLAIPSLEQGWQQWNASGCPGEWFALIPHWPDDNAHAPSWTLVERRDEFQHAAHLIVLNAEAVSYDPVIGLELAPGTPYQSKELVEQHTSWSPFDQFVQQYDEHALRTLEALNHLLPDLRYTLRHLGAHWRLPTVELERWLRLCILWHDAGKLSADWQRAAHRWQAETVRRPVADGVLARIDFRRLRDKRYPCPEHAPLSGRVIARALAVQLGGHTALLQGSMAAISHHHGIAAIGDADPTPHPEAWATLVELASQVLDERTLRRIDHAGWALYHRGLPAIPPGPPVDPDAWIAYCLLVRAIRLADREIALSEMLA